MFDAERLRDRLAERAMSQGELARRIGISQQTISRLASGERYGSKHLHRIARELGTTPAYLTGEVNDPTAEAPPPPDLSFEQMECARLFGILEPRHQRMILTLMRDLSGEHEKPAVTQVRRHSRKSEGGQE